jgi:hypothetical protein
MPSALEMWHAPTTMLSLPLYFLDDDVRRSHGPSRRLESADSRATFGKVSRSRAAAEHKTGDLFFSARFAWDSGQTLL